MKKTPLYNEHLKQGAKMVEFAGYLMPIQYTGIRQEHLATRAHAGLFDVSHMGEIAVSGENALAYLNGLLTNDFTSLAIGQVRYSLITREDGGVVDDVLVYRLADQEYWVVVNAANQDSVYQWFTDHPMNGCTLSNCSADVVQIAVQGPNSQVILEQLTDSLPQKYYRFNQHVDLQGIDCLISQTGYTGEHGYELYAAQANGAALWQLLLEAGADYGLVPVGLGARDTLRLEAGMPLYGHEISDTINPLEAGLGFAVKLTKDDFIGKLALQKPLIRKRIALQTQERFIPRQGDILYYKEKAVGEITSGTFSPSLNYSIAMALVEADCPEQADLQIKGRKTVEVQQCTYPFIKQ